MDQNPTAGGIKRRACVNCTSAKAKCSHFTRDLCERCHRLGKSCLYLDIAQTRRKANRDVSRMHALEEKVDKLVANLTVLTRKSSFSLPLESSAMSIAPPLAETTSSSPLTHAIPPSHQHLQPVPSQVNLDEDDILDIISQGLVTLDEAEMALRAFECSSFPQFPFVALNPRATVENLRAESPFLFLAIVAATAFNNPPLQRRLGMEIKKTICSKIIMRAQKNLDLLQGLLVHMAWYHHFFQPQAPQIYLMLQLCVTVVHELGIDKRPKERRQAFCEPTSANDPVESQTPTHTAAEMRALLGTYCLSSSFAVAFRKRSLAPLTKYMQECCESLANTQELASDAWIPQIVRTHSLSNRVSETFCYGNVEDSEFRGDGALQQIAEAFRRELQFISTTAPVEANDNASLLLDVDFLESWIHEIALHSELWYCMPSFESRISVSRGSLMWTLICSNKAFLQAFLSIPTSKLQYLTFMSWSKVCYVLISQVKAVLFSVEPPPSTYNGNSITSTNENAPSLPQSGFEGSWDPYLASIEADMQVISAMMIEKLASASSATIQGEGERGAFFQFQVVLKTLAANYDKNIKKLEIVRWNGSGPVLPNSRGLSEMYQEARDTTNSGGMNLAGNTSADVEAIQADLVGAKEGSMPNRAFDFDSLDNFTDDVIWDIMMQDFTAIPLP